MLTMATTAMADSMVDTDTGPTDMDTPDSDTDTMELTPTLMDTTARGLLRLSPRLTLMLTTDTTAMPAPTPMDTGPTDMDTPTDTTARGPLMPRLSPRFS